MTCVKGRLFSISLIFADISPVQEENEGLKSQLLNFRTGKVIPLENTQKPQMELTKRELEIRFRYNYQTGNVDLHRGPVVVPNLSYRVDF